MPVPQASFHITLHRFLAFLVRDASKSVVMTEAALEPLLTKLQHNSRLTHGLVEVRRYPCISHIEPFTCPP